MTIRVSPCGINKVYLLLNNNNNYNNKETVAVCSFFLLSP